MRYALSSLFGTVRWFNGRRNPAVSFNWRTLCKKRLEGFENALPMLLHVCAFSGARQLFVVCSPLAIVRTWIVEGCCHSGGCQVRRIFTRGFTTRIVPVVPSVVVKVSPTTNRNDNGSPSQISTPRSEVRKRQASSNETGNVRRTPT